VVHQALNLLASKWLLLILLALMQRPKRNSELQRQIRGVSPKMLAQSLRQLEANGLVHRQVFAEVPPRVEYSLTTFGESVAPLLAELCEWSVTWETRVNTFQAPV
jgi:DNA-binding HxlR family transcriptional regulator